MSHPNDTKSQNSGAENATLSIAFTITIMVAEIVCSLYDESIYKFSVFSVVIRRNITTIKTILNHIINIFRNPLGATVSLSKNWNNESINKQ